MAKGADFLHQRITIGEGLYRRLGVPVTDEDGAQYGRQDIGKGNRLPDGQAMAKTCSTACSMV